MPDNNAIPYPSDADLIDVPLHMRQLVDAVVARIGYAALTGQVTFSAGLQIGATSESSRQTISVPADFHPGSPNDPILFVTQVSEDASVRAIAHNQGAQFQLMLRNDGGSMYQLPADVRVNWLLFRAGDQWTV